MAGTANPNARPEVQAGPGPSQGRAQPLFCRHLLSAALFLFFLALYTATLAPGLLPADAGEYQFVGATLGVAHPPGYALYTLLSWLATRWLFPLTPARAVNFLSAVFAALTLVVTARVVRRLTSSALAGYGAALALGFSTTFWAQAVTANVRMLAALAVALLLDRLNHYRRTLSGPALAGVALALGLGVSHHGSLVFIAAVLGLYTLWLKPAALRRPWPLLAGLLPFLAWLYFPLRADLQPALATPGGFLEHVLARGFSGDILYFATLPALPDRLIVLSNTLTFEFNGALLALAALGALAALWRDRQTGVVLLAAWAVHTFIAMTYRAPQTVEYMLPAYVLMAVAIGFALAEGFRLAARLAARLRRALPLLAGIAALVLSVPLALQFATTAPSYVALGHSDSTRAYAAAVLQAAPPQALVLATWHWATPLWYLQRVEHQRPDVEVRYVFPHGASLAQNWADEIRATLPQRPVVVTSFYASEYAALGYRFVPLGPAWLAQATPLTAPPAGLLGAQTFGNLAFLGYQLATPADASATFINLTTAWRTSGPPQDLAFYVHLCNLAGDLCGQMDVRHSASQYASGEVLVDHYRVFIQPEVPAGDYVLVAGAYRPDGTRLAEVTLSPVHVNLPPPLVTTSPATAVPLGDSILFQGAKINPGRPVHPGETVTVDLHFLALRPIEADYAVKVDLIGANWSWRAQSDGTPVGGAIPTLKWIAGSRLTDRRTLKVPANATPGTAQLVLAVYDSFTQQLLPILDPALAAQGPTVPIGTVEIVQP